MKTNAPAVILLDEQWWTSVYGPAERKRLEALFGGQLLFLTNQTCWKHAAVLAEAEVLFSGWGFPPCGEEFFAALPNLKAIFHAAGSVRTFVTDSLWRRGIVVSSANKALAITVAEFTLGEILLSLKAFWAHAADMRQQRRPVRLDFPGIYESVVGLVSYGAIARNVHALLRHFRLRVVVYDPYLTEQEARAQGVEKVSLEDLFEMSDVVSLHAPWLPQTEGMIRGHHFSRMKEGATFLNTARGAIVNEAEMIEVLARRTDLRALLDVTYPDPPAPTSPLFSLPNVVLTPHIAGALGNECRRLGAMAIDEFERYRSGQPLQGEIREEMMATIA